MFCYLIDLHFFYEQVGIAYLLALERANDKTISPEDNIELDR